MADLEEFSQQVLERAALLKESAIRRLLAEAPAGEIVDARQTTNIDCACNGSGIRIEWAGDPPNAAIVKLCECFTVEIVQRAYSQSRSSVR